MLIILLIIIIAAAIFNHIHHIKERKKLIFYYKKRLEYVKQITESLQSTLDLDEVFIRTLNRLSDKFNFNPIFLYIIEKPLEGIYLKCIAISGMVSLKGIEKYSIHIEDKSDPIYSLIHNKKTVFDFNSPQLKKKTKLKNLSILPMMAANRIIGLLVTKEISDDQDLLPLKIFINEAGLSIENARLFKKVQNLSIIDELTQIYNRRYFYKRLSEEVELAKRYKNYISIAMIDVDDFKHYNDINGHLAGDICLRQIAKFIKSVTRKVDIVARYGGEEFIVILPATDKEGAFAICEKINKSVEKASFKQGEKQPLGKVTVSVGYATYPTDTQESENLVDLADKGLYRAKNSGKNKISVGI